jgi:peptidoglycan/LPS O-acetylase OafA/YrhL
MALIDALKAIAAQLILLHHLAYYGPMSDIAHPLAPTMIEWLAEHGRLAVQAFLVVGGFLAAKSLAPSGAPSIGNPLHLVARRYVRLAVPFIAALILAVLLSAVARNVMDHESIPGPPSALQILAHALLLHGVLGQESLSAGVWYVAIDFQLHTLMVIVLWLAQRTRVGQFAPAAVTALALASLYHFNRDPDWDDWALYFFGAYAMGALAFWAAEREGCRVWFGLLVAASGAALALEFRPRIAVALVTALVLGMGRRNRAIARALRVRTLAFLGAISYSTFLVHFPVCLVVGMAFARVFPQSLVANAAGMLVAWGLSNAAAVLFYRHVEAPTADALSRRAGKRSADAGPATDFRRDR